MLETTLNFIHITFSQCLIVTQDTETHKHFFLFTKNTFTSWDLKMLIRCDYLSQHLHTCEGQGHSLELLCPF